MPDLGKAYVQIIPSAQGISGMIQQALGGEVDAAGKTSGQGFAGKFAAVATKAIAALGIGKTISDSVATGLNFDKAMSQVAATMGKTMDEMLQETGKVTTSFGEFEGNLKEFAQYMGANTAFSASQAAEALNYMALAGYDADTSIKVLPNVLDLAAAGGMDLARASDMVTDACSALGIKAEDSAVFVDQLAKASSKSNTSVAQLGDAILTVGGTAKDLKGGTAELSTALGILANNGIKGADGGIALRNILLSLAPKSEEAAKSFEKLGFTAYDESGELRNLADIFADLRDELDGMSTADRTAILSSMFNKTDLKSVNAMLAAAGDSLAAVTNAVDEAGISWEKYNMTAEDACSMLDAQINAGWSLDDMLALMTSDTDGWGMSMEDATKVAESARSAVENATSTFVGLQAAIEDSSGAASQMAKVQLDNLAGDITAFKSALEGVQLIISGSLAPTLREFVQVGTTGLSNLKKALDTGDIAASMDALGGILTGGVKILMDKIPAFLQAGTDLMMGLADGFRKKIPEFLANALPMILDFTGELRANIGEMVDAGINLIMSIVEGLVAGLPDLIAYVPEIVSNIAGVINDNMPKILKAAVDIIITLAKGLWDNKENILSNMGKIFQAAIDVIMAFNWINFGKKVIDLLANGIKQLFSQIPNLLKQIGQKAVDLFKGINWQATGSQIINVLSNGIRGLFSAIPNLLKSIGQSAINLLKGIDWLGVGKAIIDGIVSGIRNFGGAISNTLMGFAKSAWKNVKGFFGISSPSRLMRDTIGKFIPMGLAEGIENNADYVFDAMNDIAEEVAGTKFSAEQLINFGGNVPAGAASGNTTNYGGVVININASDYSNPRELAEEIEYVIKAKMRREGEVFA